MFQKLQAAVISIGGLVSAVLVVAGTVGGYVYGRSGGDVAIAESRALEAEKVAEQTRREAESFRLAYEALSRDRIEISRRYDSARAELAEARRRDPTCEEAWNAPLHQCIVNYVGP